MVQVTELCKVQLGEFGNGGRIWSVAWCKAAKGTLLAACCEDGSLTLLELVQGDHKEPLRKTQTLKGFHSRSVRRAAFSYDNRLLVSVGFDASVVVYERDSHSAEWEETNRLDGHENEVKGVAFSPSGQFVATCSRDKSVWFWEVDEEGDFSVVSVLQSHEGDLKSVIWHPAEDIAVSMGYDASIRFYKYDGEDFVTHQVVQEAHQGTVWDAAFDAEGSRLITVGEDHAIQLWQRERNEKAQWMKVAKCVIEDCRWPLYSVSWSAIGLVSVAGGDGKVRILRVAQSEGQDCLELMQTFDAHDSDVNCVAWNGKDSEILASCSDDGTAKLFRITM